VLARLVPSPQPKSDKSDFGGSEGPGNCRTAEQRDEIAPF
jgi:hypothetical protein